MDWFEQLFHVDPDHGNGMLELAMLLFLAIAISMTAVRWRGRADRRRDATRRSQESRLRST